MTIYHILFLICIIAPISTFFHELGHALAAKWTHAKKISIIIGIGKPLIVFHIFKIQVVVNTFFMIGGHMASARSPSYQSKELVYVALFGPIFSGILAFFLYILYMNYPNIYGELAILFNLWLMLINIIPFKIQKKKTDGYILYEIVRNRFPK